MESMYSVLSLQQHNSGKGNPYTVAIIDDTTEGRTKLVILFEGAGDVAVLDLDRLIEQEDITETGTNRKELERFMRNIEDQ